MTLIDGDRIITAQLYDDEHEEFIEEKMSIIDNINAYTTEGITEADIIRQTGWTPVSERLPEYRTEVLTCSSGGYIEIQSRESTYGYWENQRGDWADVDEVIAWMPLPEPYKAETESEE